MAPPTAIVYPSITAQNSPGSSGTVRSFPSPHRYQSAFSICLAAGPSHFAFRVVCFRLAEALTRIYSEALESGIPIIGDIRLSPDLGAEALGHLGSWGWSRAGSAWVTGVGSAYGFQETWKRLGELEQDLKDSCDFWPPSEGKRGGCHWNRLPHQCHPASLLCYLQCLMTLPALPLLQCLTSLPRR